MHLRRLAQRDRAAIAGIGGQAIGAVTYKELAGIIDQMLAPRARNQAPGIDAKADAPLLSSEGAVQAGEARCVDIPRPSSLFVGDDNSDSEDFNTTVVVPPGGLTFIASAELVDGSDAGDADNAPAFQPLGTSSKQSETKDASAAVPSVIFPVPQSPSNASSAIITGIERAGGFALSPALPPVGGVHPSVLQQSSSDNASSGPTEMPAPAHGPANIMGSDAPPAGFSVYSAHHAGAAPTWLSAATGAQGPAAAGATTGIPSMPGVYGIMPMHHFVPHLAMQYGGFFPPHMFGMPEMSPVAGSGSEGGLQPSGSGDGRSGAKDDQQQQQQQQLSDTAEAIPAAIQQQQQQQQQQQVIGGAMLGMPMDGSMWQAPPAPAQPQTGGSLGSSTPNPPMLAGMASSESLYQHAMAAAAAGFSMAAPFMYPHADTTTLSTAATGGSDNNDSINSLDSASNRGGSSRPSSIHHYTQYSGSDAGSRGLAAQGANIAEYVPVTQYMWPQQPGGDPKHAHHHQQQHHQLQQQQQQHGSFVYPPPPPQQQQQYQQHYPGGHAGSGSHRGKDSGSTHGGSTTSGNSNSNSHTGSAGSGHYHHHHHYSYQRDRRGNNNNSGSTNSGGSGEYQRQRRWNNNSNSNSNSSGGYSRQHHQPHNSAVAVAAAQAAASNASAVSSYPAGGSQGQNETAVSFGAVSGETPPSAVASANNPGSAQSGASYYGSAFVRQ
ncbi:hypothetical protein EV177_008876 [Coemansia sp. RSA 1804]|nr:hypothetical protein EV177_008876 [Coemansia sp. RSA 1804]